MSTRYTEAHEWVRLEGDIAEMGVTAFATEQLGDVIYVELPEPGRSVAKGEAIAVVESSKAASDVYAPMSGEVAAVNDALGTAPERVNEGPESSGWFCRLRVSNRAEFDALMDDAAYAAFTANLERNK